MRIFLVILSLIPQLLVAQNAPVAHFVAANNAVCDSTYSETFTDQSTNNPTSWKWYFPGATPDTSFLQNPTNIQYKGYGCYTVKLVVKNNYGSDSLTDSNYICLDAPPHITLTGNLRVCVKTNNGKNTIFAHGGTSYLWFNGDTTSYFTFYDANNIFNVGVIVYNGACSKDTIFPLKHDTMPTYIFKGDTVLCKGDTATIYAKSHMRYKYLWSTGSTSDTLTVAGITPGSSTYYLKITNGACVKDSQQVSVRIEDCTGIENYNNDLSLITIYPNPSNGNFTFVIASETKQSQPRVEVYNILGEKVFNATLKQVQGDNSINLSNQPNGIYLYRVISETGDLIGEGKIVKQ